MSSKSANEQQNQECKECQQKINMETFPEITEGKLNVYKDSRNIWHNHPQVFAGWIYWCGTETCPKIIKKEFVDVTCCSHDLVLQNHCNSIAQKISAPLPPVDECIVQ